MTSIVAAFLGTLLFALVFALPVIAAIAIYHTVWGNR